MRCPTCAGAGHLPDATRNGLKEKCPKGHPYDAANTYVSPKGWRLCRACRKADQERRRGGGAVGIRHYAPGGVS